MEKFTGEEENRKKDSIVARSPLLRIFIDKYAEMDPDMWVGILESTFISNREEIIRVVGDEPINHDIIDLLKESERTLVFFPETSRDLKIALIFCFAWMGYEIGDEEDVSLFIDEIFDRIFQYNVLKENDEAKTFIMDTIGTGILWKADIAKDVPDLYKDFFSKIDF